MRKYFSFFFLIIIIASNGLGQSYDAMGIIYDSISNLPVLGARVEVIDASTGEIDIFITDGNGQYGNQAPSTVQPQITEILLGLPYPHPVSGTASIPFSQSGTFAMYDIRGRLIHEQKLDSASLNIEIKRDLPAGVYLYAIKSQGKVLAAQKMTVTESFRKLSLIRTQKIPSSTTDKIQQPKDQTYPKFVFINVEASGYVTKNTMTILHPDHFSPRDYVIAPIPQVSRVHGLVADQTCSTIINQGTIAVRTSDNLVHRERIQADGSFDFVVSGSSGDQVNVWLEDLAGYCGDTFTLCKMGQPSSLGTTASCVSVYEPDTLSVSLGALAYPDGHYILALSSNMASNGMMLDMVSGRYHLGVSKWEHDSLRFIKVLNQYPSFTDSIPVDVNSSMDRATNWLAGKFGTPLGLSFVSHVQPDSAWYDWGHPYWESAEGPDFWDWSAIWIHDTVSSGPVNVGWPAEAGTGYPEGYPFTVQTKAFCLSAFFNYYILEMTEALGVMDYLGGSNGAAFDIDEQNDISGFSELGLTIWSIVFTYGPGSFAVP